MISVRQKVQLALFGGIGAVAPDILNLYSKVHFKPGLSFVTWQYIVASLLYLGLAATVAVIFPYGRKPTNAKAFGVGFALPTAISVLTSFLHGRTIAPRTGQVPGTLLDLISLF
jgi:hypothetical protein